MASLTGQTISSTYDSLLKLIDNEPITSAFKEITDGVGNSSKLYLKNNGSFGFGAEPYDIGGDINVGITGSSWPTLSVVNSTTKDFISLESVSSITMINAGNIDGINYNALSFVVGGSERAKINTNGQLSLLNYTADTSFPGTVAGYLAFTSAGNIITTAGLSGTGTTNTVPKFTSASAIGNSNITDTGTLISLGSNTNISSGSLGIGAVLSSVYNLRIQRNIAGGSVAISVAQEGQLQSGVSFAYGFNNQSIISATASATDYIHYRAVQGTWTAGGVVTNQIAYFANSTLTSATNNFAFRGDIAVGTGRWNLYMTGTATNYLAGVLTIGTTSPSASALLQMNSTTQGFLPPRMTQAQRTAIASPAVGLIVYQTDGTEGAYQYKSTGWAAL